MKKYNSQKFVFWETFTNTNGKTSGSGFVGVILGLIISIFLLATIVGYFLKIPQTLEIVKSLVEAILYISILLGVRKASSAFYNRNNNNLYNPPNPYYGNDSSTFMNEP